MDDLCIKRFPNIRDTDPTILQSGILLKDVITGIRDAKNKNQIKPKERIKLYIQSDARDAYSPITNIFARQVNADSISFTQESIKSSITTVIQKDKFYIETETKLDSSNQKEQLEKELEYQKGFLLSVEKKLSNERFVQNAKPEVIELERKKKADAEAKIKAIEESLAAL
jgi:valyl-tRNA synthetase